MALDIHDLETALLCLYKGVAGSLVHMAGTGISRLVLNSEQTQYRTLLGRLTWGIASLHEEDADLPLDVFGFAEGVWGLSPLRKRLERHLECVDREIETVTAQDDKAITNLRSQLLGTWCPSSPIPGERMPETTNSIMWETAEVLTIAEDGHRQQTQALYQLLVPFDEVDYIQSSNSLHMSDSSRVARQSSKRSSC